MKRFSRQLVIFGLVIFACIGLVFWSRSRAVAAEIQNQPLVDFQVIDSQELPEMDSRVPVGQKIDLNNANAIAFMDCPGYYPTLAKEIISHGPYTTVEEVLDIPGLSPQQQQLLQDKLDLFTVTEPQTDLSTRMPPRPMMR